MFRLFFCYCLLKDTASFDFVSQEPAKISIPQEKKPSHKPPNLGASPILCRSRVLSELSARKHKKTKTPIWENNSPFQTDKTPFYFAKTAFFSRIFQAKNSTKSRLHPPRFNYRQNKNLHFLKRNFAKSKIIHTFVAYNL